MNWKTTWSYLPIQYNTILGSIENATQRTIFRNNLNAAAVKLKFSNKYGLTPITLKEVVLSSIREGKRRFSTIITCQNQNLITLQPGEEFYSDEIDFSLHAEEDLELSIYVEEKNRISSACSTYCAKGWFTTFQLNGNHTREDFTDPKTCSDLYPYVANELFHSNLVFGVSEIRVLTEDQVETIALFGDSITHMSYYADALQELLYQKYPGCVTLLNRGIGGNRILRDSAYVEEWPGNNKCAGIAAIKRYEENLFQTEVPDYIFLLEGVNDLMHPYLLKKMEELPSAEELINAYQYFIDLAHQKGSKIILGTILPFNHETDFHGPEGESIRTSVNEWIRSQTLADGYVDFEQVMWDEDDHSRMKDEYHLGDGLHPNTLGGKIMAQTAMQLFI